MGYIVEIIRSNGNEKDPISWEEIASTIRVNSNYELTHEGIKRGSKNFLNYSEGRLWISNPESEDLRDMVSLASLLGARVRGDDLETYTESGETYIHPDDQLKYDVESEKKELVFSHRHDRSLRYRLATIAAGLLIGSICIVIKNW